MAKYEDFNIMSEKLDYAAKLIDEASKIEMDLYPIELTSKESVISVVSELTKSAHTPEQIKAMLGYVLAKGKEFITPEDKETLFQGVEESDTPCTIPVTPENYQLIYKFIEDNTSSTAEASPTGEVIEDTGELFVGGALSEEATEVPCTMAVVEAKLPTTEQELPWRESAAVKAVEKYATTDKVVDYDKFKEGFLLYDVLLADELSAYKIPIASVLNKKLMVTKPAIEAALGQIESATEGMGEVSIAKAKLALAEYAQTFGIEHGFDTESLQALLPVTEQEEEAKDASAPTDTPDEKPVEEVPEELAYILLADAYESIELLTTKVDEQDAKINELEDRLVELCAEKHENLACEAARVAVAAGYPLAKTKTFDELCEEFAGRSEEFLTRLITDLSTIEAVAPKAIEVPKVENPTQQAETSIVNDPDAVKQQLDLQEQVYDELTEEESDVYTIFGLNLKDTNSTFLNTSITGINKQEVPKNKEIF